MKIDKKIKHLIEEDIFFQIMDYLKNSNKETTKAKSFINEKELNALKEKFNKSAENIANIIKNNKAYQMSNKINKRNIL
jgi:hypothetical protein